jgi:hypothetical protein
MKKNNAKVARTGCVPDRHEWVVFSTAIKDVCLMVQCVECGAHGTVDDPTKDEWAEAFYASENPYRWGDNSRVTFRSLDGDCFVERSDAIPKPMSRREERWLRNTVKMIGLTASKTNGLWHLYDSKKLLLSAEEGLDDNEMLKFLGQLTANACNGSSAAVRVSDRNL